jgi:hypothetical protein
MQKHSTSTSMSTEATSKQQLEQHSTSQSTQGSSTRRQPAPSSAKQSRKPRTWPSAKACQSRKLSKKHWPTPSPTQTDWIPSWIWTRWTSKTPKKVPGKIQKKELNPKNQRSLKKTRMKEKLRNPKRIQKTKKRNNSPLLLIFHHLSYFA